MFSTNPFLPLAPLRTIAVGSAFLLLMAGNVQGQMFGNRSVGSPLRSPPARQPSTSASTNLSEVGVLTGNERFLRGNRSREDFIGSDRNEQSGFVGAQQALGTGRVRSATDGLRIETTDDRRINRPLPLQPDRGLYYARLDIGVVAPEQIRARAVSNVGRVGGQPTAIERIRKLAGESVVLNFEGRTAILTGMAASQQAAEIAGIALSFEPGIDNVRNELQIR